MGGVQGFVQNVSYEPAVNVSEGANETKKSSVQLSQLVMLSPQWGLKKYCLNGIFNNMCDKRVSPSPTLHRTITE